MAPHPGGSFQMCATNCEKKDDDTPRVKVDVKPFCLDKLEVTVEAYEPCVKAGVCTEPREYRANPAPSAPYEHRLMNWKHPDPGRRKHPVNGVKWEQATDFCKWRGGRLPTEAEFEWALLIRGGAKASDYPWGDEPLDGTRANVADQSYHDHCGEMVNCLHFWKPTFSDGHAFTAPVGSFPKGANPWGVLDLVGNVEEWTSSVLVYESGTAGWLRGGSFGAEPPYSRTRSFGKYGQPTGPAAATTVDARQGFRCARDD